jgi:outer membrane protein TolC
LIPTGVYGQQPPKPPGEKPTPIKLAEPAPPPNTLLKSGEQPIDLGSAMRLAGVENPELLLARERLTEAAAIRMLAAAQALPNINIGSNFDLHRGPLQQSNGNILTVNRDAMYVGLGANAIAAGTVNIPGIQYNLNIGTAWFGYLQSRQIVARAAAATRTANNDVLLKVCLAYSELLRADAKRAVAEKNRSEMGEIARLTDAYAQAGQGRKADADRAAVELRKREAELLQAESDTLAASARLCNLLNLDPSTRLKPIDGYAIPVPVVPDQVPLTELIGIAITQRPELEERRAEIRQALYAVSNAKLLPFSPNVILGYSAGGFGGGSNLISTPPGFVGADGNLQTGPRFGNVSDRTDFDAVVYWTLQNLGVGNRAQIRAAQSVSRQTSLRQIETLNRVRSEVAEIHARTMSKFAQIDTVAKAVKSSTEAFDADLTRIRAREGLPIEVIDSLRLLGRSRYEYLDAIIDYNRAQFQLYVALGQPPADVLARPVPPELVPPPMIPAGPMPGQGLPPGSVPPGPRMLSSAQFPRRSEGVVK